MSLMPRLKTSAPFLLLSTIFASDLVAIKMGVTGNPPLTFAGSRYLLGGLITIFVTTARLKSRSISRRLVLGGVLLGAMAAVEFACLYFGMQYISAGASSILYYTQPIIVAAFAAPFLKEPFSRKKALALALGFVGTVLLFVENLSSSTLDIGGLLVLSSAFSWAFGIILFKKLLGKENFLLVTALMLVSAGTFLFVPGFFFEAALIVSLDLALILLYLVVVCTAFGVSLYYYLLGQYEVTKVSIWLFLVPVFAVLLGWLFLGENVYVSETVGALCVGLGIVILNR